MTRAAEMETGKLYEVLSSKPEERVTELDESPPLMERQAEDAYEGASKSMEIAVGTHPSTEKVHVQCNLPSCLMFLHC